MNVELQINNSAVCSRQRRRTRDPRGEDHTQWENVALCGVALTFAGSGLSALSASNGRGVLRTRLTTRA